MAKVPHSVETLPKISVAWVRRTDVTDRTTDRQTDKRTTTYNERERLKWLSLIFVKIIPERSATVRVFYVQGH